MIFHPRQKVLIPPDLKINKVPIERVNSFNFWGITLDENVTWNPHIRIIGIKISQALGLLYRTKQTRPTCIRKTIYNI